MDKIPVGVSECLMGRAVRFDGGHKHNLYITETLAEYFELLPACPEVAIGLGVPRKPVRIIVTDQGARVRGVENPGLDVTDALAAQAKENAQAWPDLGGYIFMQNSPSCGVFAVKRYDTSGRLLGAEGRGAYAQKLIELLPLLPVEEAGRLCDLSLRDNFITRVYAYYDWRQSVGTEPTAEKLIHFYSRYKYQVMAHSVASYAAIGKLLSDLSRRPAKDIADEFIRLFMGALSNIAGRKGNTNTMMHLRGYLRWRLSPADNEELNHLIDAYRQGEVPLSVPLALLKHHLSVLDDPYLQQQTFWSPHPEKLGLRNAVVDNL